jgi:membrane protein required for colicin V production
VQTLDLIFVILIGLLVLRGFLKGFTGEFFSIASVTLGIIGSVLFFKNGAAFIRLRYLQMDILPEIIAFLAIFIVVFIAGKILEHIIKDIIKHLNLHAFDKVLGIFLGLAEGFALIVVALFILIKQPLFDPIILFKDSFFVRFFLPLIRGGRV